MKLKLVQPFQIILLCAAVAWPNVVATAAESAPSKLLLPDAPAEAHEVAPLLRHVVDIVTSSASLQQDVKALRSESDGLRTRLTAARGELQSVQQELNQLTEQAQSLERQQRARIEALLKELEAKVAEELSYARQHISAEQGADFTREVQTFESRQHDVIAQSLDQELFLKERELDQLSQEIDVQTQELLGRLSRLDADSQVAKSLEKSTAEAIARRKAQLAARRQQLTAERNNRLGAQRREFVEKLKQQQVAEQERRMTLKEASLRSSMSELLAKAQYEDTKKIEQAARTLGDIRERHTKLTRQQALLTTRLDAISQELAAHIDQIKELENQRKGAVERLEQAFHRPNPAQQTGVLAWFGRVIQQLPSDAAAELGQLHQRLVAVAEQEQKLQAQRRMLRERQLAMQVSREVESKYQELQAKQRREYESKTRRADELLTKANSLAGRGAYDEALQLLAQAQALNPPQTEAINTTRDELLRTRAHLQRQSRTAQVEALFNRAMKSFEQGRYEESMALFQQVIDQEATQGRPGSLAGGARP